MPTSSLHSLACLTYPQAVAKGSSKVEVQVNVPKMFVVNMLINIIFTAAITFKFQSSKDRAKCIGCSSGCGKCDTSWYSQTSRTLHVAPKLGCRLSPNTYTASLCLAQAIWRFPCSIRRISWYCATGLQFGLSTCPAQIAVQWRLGQDGKCLLFLKLQASYSISHIFV